MSSNATYHHQNPTEYSHWKHELEVQMQWLINELQNPKAPHQTHCTFVKHGPLLLLKLQWTKQDVFQSNNKNITTSNKICSSSPDLSIVTFSSKSLHNAHFRHSPADILWLHVLRKLEGNGGHKDDSNINERKYNLAQNTNFWQYCKYVVAWNRPQHKKR